MIADVLTVAWKEWRGLFRQHGSRVRALLTFLAPVVVFGVWVPWDSGERWLDGPPSMFASAIIPMLVALLIVPDSFAGERERHTLPTLLASRLPDGAILLGKVLFAAGAGLALMFGVLLLGLITSNVAHGGGTIRVYATGVLLADVGLGVLLSLLAVAAGILVSLRAATAQQAQQTLTAVLFVPPTVLGPILLLVGRSRPEWRPKVLLADVDGSTLTVGFLLAIALVDVALLIAARARFRRSRLIAG